MGSSPASPTGNTQSIPLDGGTKRGMQEPVNEEPSRPDDSPDAFSLPFLDLYREQFAPMVRLAVALTGSDVLAEDLVHDAFVRVHARYRTVENPVAYLRKAVVNGCRSAARRSRRERSHPKLELIGHTELHADEMFDALSKLTYRQRAALVLTFYEGLTQAEIAEVLGCREGTVASLVHRGLGELRKVIDP
jgi:RNA polymerase sigma factor (sigma-70 family)